MVIDQLKQEIQIAESNEKSKVKDIANLTSENKALGDVQRKAKRDNVLLNDDLQNYKTVLIYEKSHFVLTDLFGQDYQLYQSNNHLSLETFRST